MATLEEVGQALRNAHEAGDVKAAELLAAEYARLREGASAGNAGPVPAAGAAGAPTGTPGEFPDRGTLKSLVTEGIPQTAAAVVKNVGSIPTLAADAAWYGFDRVTGRDPDFARITPAFRKKVDEVVEPPKTKSGQAGVRIASGGLEAVLLPGSTARNILAQTLGGVGAEVGASLGRNSGGDNGELIGGFLGGLVGGSPTAIPKGRGTYREMLAEAVKGLEPGDFAQASRIAAEARRHGITLTPEQLFDKASGLDSLVNEVARSGKGSGNLQRQMMGQTDEVQAAALRGGNQLGVNPGAARATRDLREASAGVLEQAGQTPPNVGRLFRDRDAAVSGPVIEQLDQHLSTLAQEYRGSKETVARIEDLRQRLGSIAEKQKFAFGTTTKVEPGKGAQKWKSTQVPNEVEVTLGADPAQLDLVAKSVEALLKDLKIDSPATEKLLTGRVGGAVGRIKEILNETIPTRQQGSALYRSMKERQENLMQGLPGRLARSGVDDTRPDSLTLLQRTLGEKSPQESEIAELASVLRSRAQRARAGGENDAAEQAQRALPQAARVLWDRATGDALNPRGAGRTPANAGSVLYSALAGTPGQAGNLRQLFQGVGAAQGVADPAAYADGLMSLLDVMKASGRNRGGGLPSAPAGLNRGPTAAGQVAEAGMTGSISPGWGAVTGTRALADRLSAATHAKQFKRLEALLSDPQAVNLIQQLGKAPKVSSRAAAIANVLLAATAEPIMGEEQ